MLVLGGCSGNKQAESKLCWYFPLPDPYADEVKGYAEQFAKDYNIDVNIMMGADLEQSMQDTKDYQAVDKIDGLNDREYSYRELSERIGQAVS